MKQSAWFKTFEEFNQKVNIDKITHVVEYSLDGVGCAYQFECNKSNPIVTKRILRRGCKPVVENVMIESIQDMYNLYLEMMNGRLESEFKQIEPITL